MLVRIRRIFTWTLVVLVFLVAAAAVFAFYTARRSFPQVDGVVQVPGLESEVQVLRDEFGIPHLYASSQHDLYMAQGYVHAQDRFYQMDVWRHVGAGRLSEMFGESQLETDRFLRTLGWARVAERELATLDAASAEVLNWYAAGVNAYLAERQRGGLSLEYAVLGLSNRGYVPEPWEPLDTMVWAKVMAWDLSGNLDREVERAVLLNTLTREQVDDLFPPYPSDHPVIVGEAESPSEDGVEGSAAGDAGTADAIPAAAGPALVVQQKVAALDALLIPMREGIGSNSWVVSGARTATGRPLLANDTHLGEQIPSIWYQMGLHESAPPSMGGEEPATTPAASVGGRRLDVVGFTFPGTAGVVIGHNSRIAWGFTNVGADVMDLYIEKINPENPDQYEVNGEWVDMVKVREEIHVAGAPAQTLTVRYTRHGPVVSDTYGPLEDFGRPSGLEAPVPEQYALSLRWTALEPSNTLRAVRGMNLANDFTEFRVAAQDWDVPSQNLVYADVDGHIGYQMPGRIPVRVRPRGPADTITHDGRYPVPGWTDDYEWIGYLPFQRLPFVLDPPSGYIVTANNAVTRDGMLLSNVPGAWLPGQQAATPTNVDALITYDWHYGYRAQRITDLIENAPGPLTVEDMRLTQADSHNPNAATLVPLLLDLDLEGAGVDAAQIDTVTAARTLLDGWDLRADADSPAAALFETFWAHLLRGAFADDLPADMAPRGGSQWFEVVRRLVDMENSPWWDDSRTPDLDEDRDAILARALAGAVDELTGLHGDMPSDWRWGDLHTVTFHNQTLGRSGVPLVEALFNRGPYSASGSTSLVNATNWSARAPFEVTSLPSLRMIVDLADLDASLALHTTGQSGHAFHRHYDDMVRRWQKVDPAPMAWSRQAVEDSTRDVLTLTP
ncbi:MAG: penicillin acylase family protein [Actinobacteria bacterium]|nr:penicillin acylase family protein [Actinomycetota bacterium]